MQKTFIKARLSWDNLKGQTKRVLCNTEGDQITGWLIVVLLVVVVGAFFLATYQNSIIELWNGIVGRMRTVFGI